MRYMYAKFVCDGINSRRIKFVISINGVGYIYIIYRLTTTVRNHRA